jgi:4'-phosphopantetheinyl transferase
MNGAPWEDPPRRPGLQPGCLHLWLVALSTEPGDLTRLERLLSPEERLEARRFHRPADRLRSIASRAALRKILAAYLRERPQALRLATGPSGKPYLDGLQFNLSHAGDLALVAVSKEKRVGVDIERLRELPSMQAVLSYIFTDEERGFVESHGGEQRTRGFLLIWNRREAAAKALGLDLLASFARLEVPVAAYSATGFLVPLVGTAGLPAGEGWWLRDFSPAPGYAGALCLEGGPAELSWWRFQG